MDQTKGIFARRRPASTFSLRARLAAVFPYRGSVMAMTIALIIPMRTAVRRSAVAPQNSAATMGGSVSGRSIAVTATEVGAE